MAKKKSGNKTWIMGAVLGAVAGAAYALWKTPMSGEELRSKLTPGPVSQNDEVTTDAVRTPTAGDKLLSKVEQTLAPVVGVQLGKTANGPAPTNGTETEPIAVVIAPESIMAESNLAPGSAATPPASPVVAESDLEPDLPIEAPPSFKAAEATADPGGNAASHSSDSIRAKRFTWGSPTPEAGVQPTPIEPLEENPVTEPAVAREPATPAQTVPPGDPAYGSDTIRAKRFSWGDPAPEASQSSTDTTEIEAETSQPVTDQLATAAATTSEKDSPLQAVSTAAVNSAGKRKFPNLGGLEN